MTFSKSTFHCNIEGNIYDSVVSGKKGGTLTVHETGEVILCGEDGSRSVCSSGDLRIEPRLGNTPRRIVFPENIVFETEDNDSVDSLYILTGGGRFSSFIHIMESRWRYFAAALAVIVISVFCTMKFAVPVMAKTVAFAIPPKYLKAISVKVETSLDSGFLEKSGLKKSKISRVQNNFRFVTDTVKKSGNFDFRLIVRKGGIVGANAFALPDGAVVITDELIGLSGNEKEIIAVLAHETGHVINRHGLRMLLQDSVVSLLVMFVTGDVLSYASVAAAFPALLINRGYSRDFEREADMYALNFLKMKGIDQVNFSNILSRLQKEHGASGGGNSLLSTHPSTKERIKNFMKYSKEGADNL